ncbi:MAG: adenosylcobinamide amidohydrolase [bacterium]|nr:adenosylcobinamide amidohydrolase [bacterium]
MNITNAALPGLVREKTNNHFHLRFHSPVEVLSSAILNGGYSSARSIFNMGVEENYKGSKSGFPEPEESLREYAKEQGWTGTAVGMMTSASMNSFRHNTCSHDDVIIECFLTAGVSNARRAGDPADWKFFGNVPEQQGTINIVAGTNARLTGAALVEALMIITEAKAAVLQELNIRSPLSGEIATGTGTDSTAFFNGTGREIDYCGKHVLFGEMLARVVSRSLRSSLEGAI